MGFAVIVLGLGSAIATGMLFATVEQSVGRVAAWVFFVSAMASLFSAFGLALGVFK